MRLSDFCVYSFSSSSIGSRPGRRIPNSRSFSCTLPMQTNGRCRSRNIPSMVRKLLSQVRYLELVLGLAKILFAQPIGVPIRRMLLHQGFAARHFLWSSRDVDFFAAT